ncbi:MAG: VanZ family protein, partial [Erysipelotrichaceae bacterium]|nr:VanZ family protein [Erysipelotrichaceae bacterium]
MKRPSFVWPVLLDAVALYFLIGYYRIEWDATVNMTLSQRFFFLSVSCISMYVASVLWCQRVQGSKRTVIMRVTFFVYLLIYLSLVVTLTLLDPMMGRSVDWSDWSVRSVIAYAKQTANLEPFYMMKLYYYAYVDGIFSLGEFLMNMVGNVLLLMPLAIFLPMFTKKKSFFAIVRVGLGMSLLIEVAQMITMCGYFDVDDLILNVGGLLLFTILLKIPPVHKL